MNAEKIYIATKEAMDWYIRMNELGNVTDEMMESMEKVCLHLPLTTLYRLNKEAQEEMYRKNAKGSSAPSLSAVKRLLKECQDKQESIRKAWNWTSPYGKNLWVLCDGYRAVALTAGLPTIPTYDPDHDKYKPVDIGGVLRPIYDGTHMEEMETPSLAEVKQAILDAKANGDKNPKIKVNGKLFNAKYMQDMIEILPNARMYQTDDKPISPAFFMDEDGNVGIILPIRP